MEAYRIDQREVDGITMVEVWHCEPPPAGQPWETTIITWDESREDVSQVDIWQWRPL